MLWGVLESPIGDLAIAVDGVGVCFVRFAPFDVPSVHLACPATETGLPAAGPDLVPEPEDSLLTSAITQLANYFAGQARGFDVPLSVRQGSEFERAVWAELLRIPYGETRTYGEIATATGDAGAARAVGMACNRNPLPLFVPCHRVVGAGHRLVGFGGGLPRKRYLLELEAAVDFTSSWGV